MYQLIVITYLNIDLPLELLGEVMPKFLFISFVLIVLILSRFSAIWLEKECYNILIRAKAPRKKISQSH